MSGTSYNGIPGNVVAPSAVNIVSSTNASPIIITTAIAHGMKTGDVVQIDGHAVNTAANGRWRVVVVDAVDFQLVGSTGNGSGVATGTATPLVFTGNVSLNPANGDAFDANTFTPGFSCLADRTAFLASHLPAWKTVTRFQNSINVGDFTDVGSILSVTSGTWTDWTGTLPSLMPFLSVLGAPTLAVNAGDVARVRVVASFRETGTAIGTSNNFYLNAIWFANWVPGGTETFSRAGGGAQLVGLDTSSLAANPVDICYPLNLSVDIPIGTTGLFDFKIRLLCNQTVTSTLAIRGEIGISYELVRPTGWPQ